MLSTLLFLFSTLIPREVLANCTDPIGTVFSVQGLVTILKRAVTPGTPVCAGELIEVGVDGRAGLRLTATQTVVRLSARTKLSISPPKQSDPWSLGLLNGIVHLFSREPESLRVVTPYVNAAVEGTEFIVAATGSDKSVTVIEGRVHAYTTRASAANLSTTVEILDEQRLDDGDQVSFKSDRSLSPIKHLTSFPTDSVQWALYYPPIGVDATAPANVLQAAEFLAIGQVEKAIAELGDDPKDPVSLSLLSITRLTRNETDAALSYAEQAIKNGPELSAPHLAMSYVLQSRHELEKALESARNAARVDPGNGLALARQAELEFSLGDQNSAKATAEKAVEVAKEETPDFLPYARTSLGFIQLAHIEIDEATELFKQAIESDQANPLPHLGLGLALIKKNQLEEGRAHVEIATSLDPNNSLFRSYLGKAYYEEKRDPLDGEQYVLAKRLDPRDPTPWLYDGIRKQTLNQPVEALENLKKSIELNDNRALFRSKLQLDQDLATRSASLARTYRDLGFNNLGFLQGWHSLDVDPGNFSAHRFLADTYAGRPRHEIARQSELLQSQLRQPLVIQPVQTQIGELGTFIQQDTGPRNASFNEYTPLFVRDRPAFILNGMVGGNNTWGDEVLVSGISGKASFSLGQFHYETDGPRVNADQEQDSLVAFAQYAATPSTSIQAEIRTSKIDRGDLLYRIDPDDFLPGLRENIDEDIFRLGFRHDLSTKSDLIGSYWHQTTDTDLNFGPGDTFFNALEGDQAELQHLYRFQSAHLRTGGSYFDGTRTDTNTFEGQSLTTVEDQTDASLYTYANIQRSENLTFTLGLSAQTTEGGLIDSDQLNPKFGLVWNPDDARQTTVRLAAFRTLQRSITSDQTLEPTTIAGFNQFFYDAEGTDASRYGVGLDHQFNQQWFAGLEYSHRDLSVTGQTFTPFGPELAEGDLQERSGRAYLYWVPHSMWSLSGELSREEFQREDGFTGPEEILDLSTDLLALGANFFHPSGFRANMVANYINQDGTFGSGPPFGEYLDDGEKFWVVDLNLGYRLPRRLGMLNVGVKNLLDEEFRYQGTDLENPRFVSGSFVFAGVSLSL